MATVRFDFEASHDFIEHGLTGHRFPRGDWAALAELMRWHHDHPQAARCIGRRAKVGPDAATLAAAYRKAVEHEHMAAGLPELRAAAQRTAAELAPPDDLAERVRRELEQEPELSWDDVWSAASRATAGRSP